MSFKFGQHIVEIIGLLNLKLTLDKELHLNLKIDIVNLEIR